MNGFTSFLQGKGLPGIVLDVTTNKESKPDEVQAQEPLYSSVNRIEQQTEKVVSQEAIEYAKINQVEIDMKVSFSHNHFYT